MFIDIVMCTWNSNSAVFQKVIKRICNFVDLHHLIVVDRFSGDGTLEVIKKIVPEEKLIIVKADCDLAEARYVGIQQVDTPLFAFIDSDVIIPIDWQRSVEWWMRIKRIGAVGLPLCGKRRLQKGVRIIKPYSNINPHEIVNRGLFYTTRGYTFATMIRTSLIIDWKPPQNLSALEDFSLSQHITSKGFLWIELPEPCCHHLKEAKYGTKLRHLKQGLWEGANSRIIRIKERDLILEVCARIIGSLLNALIHRDPLSLLNNIFFRVGQVIGFLLPYRFRVWHR